METAVEDDEIGERMDAGRRALLERGDNEVGPYQSPMEDGMQHFHEWYRQIMGAHIPSAKQKFATLTRAASTRFMGAGSSLFRPIHTACVNGS